MYRDFTAKHHLLRVGEGAKALSLFHLASREFYDPAKVEGLLQVIGHVLTKYNDEGVVEAVMMTRIGFAARAVEMDGVIFEEPQQNATVEINGVVMTEKVV
jgi:hypothetical protein